MSEHRATDAVPHFDKDGNFAGLRCPRGHIMPTLGEVDVSERRNKAVPELVDGRLVLGYSTGLGEYHHARWECGACGEPVSLPDDIEIEESWD